MMNDIASTPAHDSGHPHVVGYATFIKVWPALMVLTLLLVGLSTTHVPGLAVLAMLVITPTKAILVFFYFMHLKYESTALKYMVAIALFAVVIFVGLTFTDFLWR